jgi:hypothetical protein
MIARECLIAAMCLGFLTFLLAGPNSARTAGPASGSSPAASKPATSQPATLLEYERTGGFAGTNDTLTVFADGRYKTTGKLAGKHEGLLDANTLAGLSAALTAAKITADAQYRPDHTINDGFHYTLKTGGHTVQWEDGAKTPAELAALARQLSEVLSKAKG